MASFDPSINSMDIIYPVDLTMIPAVFLLTDKPKFEYLFKKFYFIILDKTDARNFTDLLHHLVSGQCGIRLISKDEFIYFTLI